MHFTNLLQTVVNCIRTIYLFTSAYPATLSGSNASTLLPYLKNATTVRDYSIVVFCHHSDCVDIQTDEQTTSDYLLKIFRVSIPHMPKTAAKFGHELQQALQPMILKPSTAGGVLVSCPRLYFRVIIPCLC